MNNKDQTTDKLVASIRKTRADSATTTPKPADRSATKSTSKAADKPVSKPAPTRRQRTSSKSTQEKPASKAANYQSARRVWPD